MSYRIVEPRPEVLNKLRPELTRGEQALVRWAISKLPPAWEVYVRPYLNGLAPSMVVLNPYLGFALYYVVQPVPASLEQEGVNNWSWRNAADGGASVPPLSEVKDELHALYCPRLESGAGFAASSVGVLVDSDRIEDVDRARAYFKSAKEAAYATFYPIVGLNELSAGDSAIVLPSARFHRSKFMTHAVAEDLRAWLREPFFSSVARSELPLDERQRQFVETRTATGYRRIKGAAGCGKSLVLAARAATLADQGKSVAVVSFNLTLASYLRDLAIRHTPKDGQATRRLQLLSFHSWCKRVCTVAGKLDDYRAVWRKHFEEGEDDPQQVLATSLPKLVQQAYKDEKISGALPRYDAILVDEGQDFSPEWWSTLRLALVEGGEMLLVADRAQDIYGAGKAWTEDVMSGAGFSGQWATLEVGYRLPPRLASKLRRFAETYLPPDQELELPRPRQGDLPLAEERLRWVQVPSQQLLATRAVAELKKLMSEIPEDTAMSDIVMLANRDTGREICKLCEVDRIHVVNTFDLDERTARKQKLAFKMAVGQVKATTLHSFKGWESRNLLVALDEWSSLKEASAVYAALTRLLWHPAGCNLVVVSASSSWVEFGRELNE